MKRRPFILYHWSPVERRASILKRGLVPGCRPVTHTQRFPVLCWSDSPSMAWALSATHKPHGEWDLWMTWSDTVGPLRRLLSNCPNRQGYPAEWRSKERVPKSRIWHVGTRAHKGRKR